MTKVIDSHPDGSVDDPDQILWGARAIGKAINRTTAQTFRMLKEGLLPAKKLKKIWVSTLRQLRQALTGEAAS
jgi:hypothetical protein